MRIPHTTLAPATLRAIVQEFVTRDGTDHSPTSSHASRAYYGNSKPVTSSYISINKPRLVTSYLLKPVVVRQRMKRAVVDRHVPMVCHKSSFVGNTGYEGDTS